MGLNQADSMAVVNIVFTGIAILGYMMMSSSHGQNSVTANKNQTAAYRNSVGGKTRRRR